MNIRVIYTALLVILIYACYEDKGNYDYKEINELEILGIESTYALDVDDLLEINPVLKGTLYDDEDRFDYRWEVARQTLDTVKNLSLKINLSLGSKLCRFIVTDKETGVESAVKFNMTVSSSTAGDLLMVLSNYKGNAELSYKRLDKEADFSINYHEERFGEVLGTAPKKIIVNYDPDTNLEPFTQSATNGGLQILMNEGLRRINKNTLEPIEDSPYITEAAFQQHVAPYPATDMSGYDVEWVNYEIGSWRITPYGGVMRDSRIYMISGGALYSYYYSTSSTVYIYANKKSPYEGKLSPYLFFPWKVYMDEGAATQKYRGYKLPSYWLMFDETVGRFTYSNFGGNLQKIDDLPAFPGYKLIYGTHTNTTNETVAVLSNGSSIKMIMLQAPGSASEETSKPFAILGQKDVASSVINEKTTFYCMAKSPYLLWTTGDKIFRYNVLDLISGGAPTASNVIATLSDYGYSSGAEITTMHVSRSERTVFLGVSRYGTDTDGESDELKGDVVRLNLNTLNISLSFKEKYESVCGYPVHVNVKHQYWYREGENNDGILTDTI